MKKLICVILTLILALSLCACEKLNFAAKLHGTWTMDYLEETELRDDLLTAIELYDEEIALVTADLHGVKQITFYTDNAYDVAKPVTENKACVREFFDQVFNSLYAGQASLEGLYEQDISTMNETDFKQFYAELYGAENYEALLDKLAENAFTWTDFGVTEEGTYTVGSEKIKVDTDGTENDGTIKYKLDGDTLTLTYANGTETYKRAD